MSFEMIPYVEWDGVRTFPDSYMKALYAQCRNEGHIDTVFYEGTVRDEDDFLKALKESICWVLVRDNVTVGVIWLNRNECRFARMHFIVFDDCPRRELYELGRFTYRTILNMQDRYGRYCYDMLLGHVPARNKVAIKYVQKCGGKLCGTIPCGAWIANEGRSEPVAVLSITRELMP